LTTAGEVIHAILLMMKTARPRAALVLAAVLLSWSAVLAGTATTRSRHVTATLVSDVDAVVPGQPLRVGLRLEPAPGWHTYWKNPGDSGLPTTIRWELPDGFTAGEIQWPRPQRIAAGPVVSYGYEGDVLLVSLLSASASATGTARVVANVRWLECKEVCLPAKGALELMLPVRSGPLAPSSSAALFAEAARRRPAPPSGWSFRAEPKDGAVLLYATAPRVAPAGDVYFCPEPPQVVDYAAAQTVHRQGARLEIRITPAANGIIPDVLRGVLVVGEAALEVEAPIAGGAKPSSGAIVAPTEPLPPDLRRIP
jgi:DsbC/DsbD-like thiol-disulfide interchange protein